jgi:hypothetical protein
LVNVATPLTAVAVVVPPRVAVPGFAPRAIVTTSLKQVCVVPDPSRAVTVTAIGDPAVVLPGCDVNARVVTVQTAFVLSEWHVATVRARAAADPARARRTGNEERWARRVANLSERIRVPSRHM